MPFSALLFAPLASGGPAGQPADRPFPTQLQSFIAARTGEFDEIPSARRAELDKLTAYVRTRQRAGQPIQLTFLCTHNSRRSHMSQIWAAAAAHHYGVAGVQVFSGGTEATAFNPRAVLALRSAGFLIEQTTRSDNPIYQVRYAADAPPLTAFSKVYNQAPNPQQGYCAVMTCSAADQACPIVAGADSRIAIPYEDPKAFDGTEREAPMYAERSAQIGREMLYVFWRVSGGKV